MAGQLRDAWAPAAAPTHAPDTRERRHVGAFIAVMTLIAIIMLAPITNMQRALMMGVIGVYGVGSAVVRHRNATVGGRPMLEPAISAMLGVGMLAVAPRLAALGMGIVLTAVTRATAMRGQAAGASVLVGADALLLLAALVHGMPAEQVAFAALVHPMLCLGAIAAVGGAVEDRDRAADGRRRVDAALVAFGDANPDDDRDTAVCEAVTVLLGGISVLGVSVDLQASGRASDGPGGPDSPDVEGFERRTDAPVVRLQRRNVHQVETSDAPLEAVVAVPMRAGGQVVGVLEMRLGQAPSAEELHLMDVLADRLTATLLAEDAREREHAARVELENAEVLRDQIMARVTHDLRAPLSTITGSVYTLSQYADELPPETVARLYELLERNASRVTNWVESLLDHALHGEEVELDPELVTVRALMSAGVEASDELLSDLRVEVVPVDGEVMADMTAVTRVLVNLLSNAAKYAPAGSLLEVRAERSAAGVTVLVADRGPGIVEVDEDHVFEPFFRSKDQPANVHGTGVGLATVRDLVRGWGGEVGHRPTRGGGATFWFTIPDLLHDAQPGDATGITVVPIGDAPSRRAAER